MDSEVYTYGFGFSDVPIERITRDDIRTSRAEHPLDVIVYATGFDAGTGSIARIDIRGEGGMSLADKWRQGPKTSRLDDVLTSRRHRHAVALRRKHGQDALVNGRSR